MKIGLIIYGTLDTLTGGYLYDKHLVSYLRSCGHDVRIFSQEQRAYLLNIAHNWDSALFGRIQEADLDILLEDELNHPSLYSLNRRIRDKLDIPVIGIVHALRCGFPMPFVSVQIARVLERKFFRSLDGYITVSEHTRKQVQDLLGKELTHTVAYPAGDRFSAPGGDTNIKVEHGESGPLQLLFLGNLTPNKNLAGLLEAVSDVESEQIHLTVVGDTESNAGYSRKIRRFIDDHNMQSRVTFAGQVAEPTSIGVYYKNAHMLVLPSFSEGYPLVHVEAAGFGVPSIATSSSGAVEFIEHGVNGFIVDPEDTSAIRQHLEDLVHDRELLASMSRAALERYRSHPTWRETGERVLDFIEKFVPGEDPMSNGFSYQQYLAAKRTVDDRALNPEVFSRFIGTLREMPAESPVRILEIGAGIGTMAERLLTLDDIPSLEYTALDIHSESLKVAQYRLTKFLGENGWDVQSTRGSAHINAHKGDDSRTIRFTHAEALAFASDTSNHASYDVIMAHAVLDMFHIRTALPVLLQTLESGGVYCFTLNYNGRTAFHPPIDPDLEDLFERRYNESMDRLETDGKLRSGSRSGDHMLEYLSRETELLVSGDSDWEVVPGEGGYPAEEAYFVQCILKDMEEALSDDPKIDQRAFQMWMETRSRQLTNAHLEFRAHNMDFLGRVGMMNKV